MNPPVPPEPDPPEPGPDPPTPSVPDNVWRVLSEDVSEVNGGTYYKDVMSANGAFVGTVCAGWDSINWYSDGIFLLDGNYYLCGLYGANDRFAYFDQSTSKLMAYYSTTPHWRVQDTPGAPFDKVPSDVLTYLTDKDFTLTVE